MRPFVSRRSRAPTHGSVADWPDRVGERNATTKAARPSATKKAEVCLIAIVVAGLQTGLCAFRPRIVNCDYENAGALRSGMSGGRPTRFRTGHAGQTAVARHAERCRGAWSDLRLLSCRPWRRTEGHRE